MKSSSDIRPSTFEKVGDGSWFYNYNVTKVVETSKESEQEQAVYYYDQVRVFGLPSDNILKEAVIRERYTAGEEANLINNCRRYDLKLTTDVSMKTKYIEFLNEVDVLKRQVDDDIANYSHEII